MTYWATLFYAGQVVLTLGFEGDIGKANCEALIEVMMDDISTVYSDPVTKAEVEASMFPKQEEFKAECLDYKPEIADQYVSK